MSLETIFRRFGIASAWSRELAVAALGLLMGVGIMPVLIFYAGASTLGVYDGASLGHVYRSLFEGLSEPSIASWTVLLGPYGLYLLFKALRTWWRASAHLA